MPDRARGGASVNSETGCLTDVDTARIERFNRSYRTEVLNAHLFESIAELQALTIAWLRIYNEERSHDSLGRVPPLTFLPRPTTARESTYAVPT